MRFFRFFALCLLAIGIMATPTLSRADLIFLFHLIFSRRLPLPSHRRRCRFTSYRLLLWSGDIGLPGPLALE